MQLTSYGLPPAIEGVEGIPARITAVHRNRYALICEHGEVYGRLKAKEYYILQEDFPTTGDFVLLKYLPDGDSLILKTLPRKTIFSRRDPLPGHGEQAVAANFDYVFVVQSLNHDFNPKRLERYLTLSWQSGAVPVVILTKADLAADCESYLLRAREVAPGVEVCAVSAKSGAGLDALSAYLQPGKTLVLLGSSGVGKSSLVNALAGEDIMAVNDIREDDSRGRHTTTHRQLLMLPCGAMIIDTPGMRELGMWDVSAGLGDAFSDVEQYLGKCKFPDCHHRTEPGCAIRAALESGALPEERYQSYCRLRGEAAYTDDKADYLRRKQQWHKSIIKSNKQRKAFDREYAE